jgi:hypothetical protein
MLPSSLKQCGSSLNHVCGVAIKHNACMCKSLADKQTISPLAYLSRISILRFLADKLALEPPRLCQKL